LHFATRLAQILEMMIVLKGHDDDHHLRRTPLDGEAKTRAQAAMQMELHFFIVSLLTLQLRFRSHFGLPPKWT